MADTSLITRIRWKLGEWAFLLAGWLNPAYDVWIDDAEPRHTPRPVLFPATIAAIEADAVAAERDRIVEALRNAPPEPRLYAIGAWRDLAEILAIVCPPSEEDHHE